MLKLLFTGDFATIGRNENYPKKEICNVFSEVLPILNDVNLHVTNLECPLTLSSKPINKTGPSIKANPETSEYLIQSKVGVACLANNHLRDFGDRGIEDTLNICSKNKILTVGGGVDKDEASKVLYVRVKKKIIAFLNYCETEFSIATLNKAGANPLDLIQLYKDITESKRLSDYVIVIYHGGNEFYSLPSIRIKSLFHHCIDLGADAVIGHHTHVFSGYEMYKGKPLVYCLGNFLFDEPENPFEGWFTGLMAEVWFDSDKISLILHPIRQSKTELKIELVKGIDKNSIVNEINRLSKLISDDDLLLKEYNKLCKERGINLIKAISNLSFIQKVLLKMGLPLEKVVRDLRLRQTLNLIQCESHRDLICSTLRLTLNKSI